MTTTDTRTTYTYTPSRSPYAFQLDSFTYEGGALALTIRMGTTPWESPTDFHTLDTFTVDLDPATADLGDLTDWRIGCDDYPQPVYADIVGAIQHFTRRTFTTTFAPYL